MVIGITGTDGAGKGTVVKYLVEKKGFTHYSARELLLAEIQKRGLEPSRNQMRLVANELRSTNGDEFIAKQAYEKIAEEGVQNAVIESIRAVAEANYIRENKGILLAVDASPTVRYQRVQGRRSESDKVTYEEFIAHEELEKNDPDPHGMQKAKVMEMADYTIFNDDSIKELQQKIEEFCKEYGI